MLLLYWRAIRGRFLTISVFPVFLGAAAAHRFCGARVWPSVLLVLAGALLVHAGSNLWNDYADELNGTDRINLHPSPFNGGSRVIQEGILSVPGVKKAALGCYFSALAVSMLFVRTAGWMVPAFTLIGILCGLGYSSRPAWFSGRGLGEMLVGVSFGPLLSIGSAYALTGRMLPLVLCLSFPPGLLVTAILVMNEIPDSTADALAGKMTIPARRGPLFSLALFCVLIGLALLCPPLYVVLGVLPVKMLITLAAVPLVIFLVKECAGGFSNLNGTVLSAGTIVLHSAFSLLLVLSCIF